MDEYKIAKEWKAGFVAALAITGIEPNCSSHWEAGYKAGWDTRKIRNDKLNEYMVTLGLEPFRTVQLCETNEKTAE